MNKKLSKKIHKYTYPKILYSSKHEMNTHIKIFLSNISYEYLIEKIYKINSKKK